MPSPDIAEEKKRWLNHPVTAVDIERLGHNAVAALRRPGTQPVRRNPSGAPYPAEWEHFPDLLWPFTRRQIQLTALSKLAASPHDRFANLPEHHR
jgi:hypothetical protein